MESLRPFLSICLLMSCVLNIGLGQKPTEIQFRSFSCTLFEPKHQASQYPLFVVIQQQEDSRCAGTLQAEVVQAALPGYLLYIDLAAGVASMEADSFVHELEEVLIELKQSRNDMNPKYLYMLGTCSASQLAFRAYQKSAVPFVSLTMINPGDIAHIPEIEGHQSVLVLNDAIPIRAADIEAFKKFNQKRYNWEVAWRRYEARKHAYIKSNRKSKKSGNIHVGINSSLSFLLSLSQPDSGRQRTAIGMWGINLGCRLGRRWHLGSRLQFSLNIPNQKNMQADLQSQVMSALFSGANSVQIQETISGHIGMTADVMLSYLFSTGRWRPFISAGLGTMRMQQFRGEIDMEIDVSGGISSLMTSSGLEDLQNPEGFELTNRTMQLGSIIGQLGIETRLGSKFRYHAEFELQATRAADLRVIGLSTGLDLLIGTGKRQALFPLR